MKAALLGRFTIFVAALAPMAIWPLSGAPLQHPLQVASWSLICASVMTLAPGRGARLSVWVMIFTLPLTLAWMGTVAVTGMGLSNATLYAAISASMSELTRSCAMALHKPDFLATAILSIMACGWALVQTRAVNRENDRVIGVAFLAVLAPTVAINLAGDYGHEAAIVAMGQETRSSVPLISNVRITRDLTRLASNAIANDHSPIQNVNQAPKLFTAGDGLSIFILGESLRADALMVEGRGPWSKAIQERLDRGLGVRISNACANANGTTLSALRLLALADSADEIPGPTFLAMAKVAGARTAWISNQPRMALEESGHDYVADLSTPGEGAFDAQAIELLSDFAAKTYSDRARAALVHLYGQHFHYQDRYPRGMFGAEPAGYSEEALLELRYQRAAEYGAKTLADAADILDREIAPAFLVFTSDHGENLPSDGTGKNYHASSPPGWHDTIVPTLILWNRAFADSGRARNIEKLVATKVLIAHQDVVKAWLSLAGMPGMVEPSTNPATWASLDASHQVPCSTLKK